MPGKFGSVGLLRGPKGDTGPAGPAGADGVGGGGGAIHVADLTALRSVTPEPVSGTVYYVGSDPEPYVYDRTSGIGFADDGDTIIRISAGATPVALGSNGRFYRSNNTSVVATYAAARLAVSGKQKTIVVQSRSSRGDKGEGHFDYDPNDTSSTDNDGTILVAGTRRFKRRYAGRVNVKWFGAKGDARSIAANFTIASGTTLSFTGTNLTAADVGKTLWLALNSGAEHKTTIVSVNPGAHTAVLLNAVPSAATTKHGVVATDDADALQACATFVQSTSQMFITNVGFIQRPAHMFLPPGDYYCSEPITTVVGIEGESASIFTGSPTVPLFETAGLTGKVTWTGVHVHHCQAAMKAWGATFNTSYVPDITIDACRHTFLKFFILQNTAVNCNVKITNHHGEWGGLLKGSGYIATIDTVTGTSRLSDTWTMTANGSANGGDWDGGGFIEVGGTEDGFTCGTTAEVASAINCKNISLSPGINNSTGAEDDQSWFSVKGVCLLNVDGRFGGESAGMPLIQDQAGIDGCRFSLGDGTQCPSGKFPVLDLHSAWEALQVSPSADLNYGDTGKPVAVSDEAYKKLSTHNWMHPTLRCDTFPAPVLTVTGDLGSETVTNPVHLVVEIVNATTFKVQIDDNARTGSSGSFGSNQTIPNPGTYAVPGTSLTVHFPAGTYPTGATYISVGYLEGQYNYSADINHTVTAEPVGVQPAYRLAKLSRMFKLTRPKVVPGSNLSGVSTDTFYSSASASPNHLASDSVPILGCPGIRWYADDGAAIDITTTLNFPESLPPGDYTAVFPYASFGITGASYVAYSTLGAAPARGALEDTRGAVQYAAYSFHHDGGSVSGTHIGSLLFSLGAATANETKTFTASSGTDKLTVTGHHLAVGDAVFLTVAGGTLPTASGGNLAAATLYYIGNVSGADVKLSRTYANALAGTTIDLTSNGSGTMSISKASYFRVGTTALFAGAGQTEWVPSELVPVHTAPREFIGGETAPSSGYFNVGDIVWNMASPGVSGKYDYHVCTAAPHTFKSRGYNPLVFSKSSSSIGSLATGRVLTDEHTCAGVSMGWRVHVAYSFDLDDTGDDGWLVLAEANENGKIKTRIVNLTGSPAAGLGGIDFVLYAWPPEE